MTSLPTTERTGNDNVKNGRQSAIATKRSDLNAPVSTSLRGPLRPVRVKRAKEPETANVTYTPDVNKEAVSKSEKAPVYTKSRIAVLTPSGKNGNGVDIKIRSSKESGTAAPIESQTVQRRPHERHIHFSDEQDKCTTNKSETSDSNSDKKRHLKDKRDFFRRSKSSSNSEHVSGDPSPFSEISVTQTSSSPLTKRRLKTREVIPLKDLTKTVPQHVVPQQTVKEVDQTEINRGLRDELSLKEGVTYRTHAHPSIAKREVKEAGEGGAQRSFQSPIEQRSIKSDSAKPERGHFNKQQPPKQFLSPEIVSPVIEKSKSQQRLQNQSSTETSGLGETITSGFTSQESLASVHSTQTGGKTASGSHSRLSIQEDLGIDLREDTTFSGPTDNDTFETETIDSRRVINGKNEQGNRSENIKSRFINTSGPIHTPSGSPGTVPSEGREFPDKLICYRPMKHQVDQHQIHFLGPTDQLNNNGASKKRGSQPNTALELGSNLDQEGGTNGIPDFDELFQQSETLPVVQAPSMGLGIEQINNEWNRHTRASSIKSLRSNRSSQGSFRSRSGSTRRSKRFLGEQESKWMKWGRERRSSFRRRLDKLEHPEPEVPKRPSTPIKKARQEGRMFIHPDLESKYISEEDINYIQRHRQQRLQTYNVIEKSKSSTYHYDRAGFNRLTANDLNILARFWEHRVFVRSRYISILLSFVTVVIYIVGISSSNWIIYPSEEVIGAEAHEGLFFACRPVYIDGTMEDVCDGSAQRGPLEETSYSLREPACERTDDNETSSLCLETMPRAWPSNDGCPRTINDQRISCCTSDWNGSDRDWQNAVIGLMIFSAAFGFVSAVLAVLGVCTSPLPKKIYYFHSAGEIFLYVL